MSDEELINRIYERCPSPFERNYTIDQFVDRCQDIRELIERERPKVKGNNHPQQEAGIDY